MFKIDGSKRSGSGTIVRDAVAYSILAQQELRLTNIRAGRANPGLRPQHLAAIQACAELCRCRVRGAAVGSREITLRPGGAVAGGSFLWDIGTAGSSILLAMSVLPLGLYAESASRCCIQGGLFQDFAPTAVAFLRVFLPVLRDMGVYVAGKIIRPGYVPKGGGAVEVQLQPVNETLKPLYQTTQGRVSRITGVALSSHLTERKVSERMAASCEKLLRSRGLEASIEILHDTHDHPAYEGAAVQPGACLALCAETDAGCLIGADMAGARGRSAERIGKETASALLEDLASGATVDRHLADQIVPFGALAEGWSSYRIPRMTDHMESRLWLAERMLGVDTEVRGNVVRIRGIGYRRGRWSPP